MQPKKNYDCINTENVRVGGCFEKKVETVPNIILFVTAFFYYCTLTDQQAIVRQ